MCENGSQFSIPTAGHSTVKNLGHSPIQYSFTSQNVKARPLLDSHTRTRLRMTVDVATTHQHFPVQRAFSTAPVEITFCHLNLGMACTYLAGFRAPWFQFSYPEPAISALSWWLYAYICCGMHLRMAALHCRWCCFSQCCSGQCVEGWDSALLSWISIPHQ